MLKTKGSLTSICRASAKPCKCTTWHSVTKGIPSRVHLAGRSRVVGCAQTVSDKESFYWVQKALTLNANFVALYAVCPGSGTKPDKEDTIRMCPFLLALHSSMHSVNL